jgi:hypothetical protein
MVVSVYMTECQAHTTCIGLSLRARQNKTPRYAIKIYSVDSQFSILTLARYLRYCTP